MMKHSLQVEYEAYLLREPNGSLEEFIRGFENHHTLTGPDVIKRVSNAEFVAHPDLPKPNSDGTYDYRHFYQYAVACIEAQWMSCVDAANGIDARQGPAVIQPTDLPKSHSGE